MQDNFNLKKMAAEDRNGIMDIFNYYIENSFAAYPEHKLGYEFFDLMLQAAKGYPALTMTDAEGQVAGFGFIRPFHPMPAFRRTGEVSYFLKPGYTGQGLGETLLAALIREAQAMQIDCIVANICSLNHNSIKFHSKHGFAECGRFQRVGKKKDTDFDIVWMQKLL